MSRPDLPAEVGPYRLTDYQGEGALGYTAFAHHQGEGYGVVVRLLPVEPGYELAIESPAFREAATIIAAMSHISLADVLEVCRVGRYVCVIEEAVPGQTLAQRLREGGPLGVAEARQIIAQVLLAVDFAHQRGFPHGLVKPSSIFLMDRHLSVKVVDAGLPELLRHIAPQRYARVMSSPYAAPELRAGHAPSLSGDMYSLGVTFCAMLTGSLPGGLSRSAPSSDAGRADLPELDGEGTQAAPAPLAEGGTLLEACLGLSPAEALVIEQALKDTPEQRPPTIRDIRVAFGFAKPAPPGAQRTMSGPLEAMGVEGAQGVEDMSAMGQGVAPCPACRRPLRPGAMSCLACGYVLPPSAPSWWPQGEPLPRSEPPTTGEHLEVDGRSSTVSGSSPPGQASPPPPQRSSVPLYADPLVEEEAPAVRTGEMRVDFFVAQGDRLLAAGRYEEALKAYRSAAGDTAASAVAHNRAGDVCAMLRLHRDAQRHYERAIALNPADLDARHDLGRVLLTLGESAQAAYHLQAVVLADPCADMRLSALTHLGSAYCAQGLLDKAVEAWTRVVREGPPNAPVRYSLGVALARLGRSEEAKAEWRAALEADPSHAESRAALTQAESIYGGDFLRLQRVPSGPGRGLSLLDGALEVLGSLLGPWRYG